MWCQESSLGQLHENQPLTQCTMGVHCTIEPHQVHFSSKQIFFQWGEGKGTITDSVSSLAVSCPVEAHGLQPAGGNS